MGGVCYIGFCVDILSSLVLWNNIWGECPTVYATVRSLRQPSVLPFRRTCSDDSSVRLLGNLDLGDWRAVFFRADCLDVNFAKNTLLPGDVDMPPTTMAKM